MDLYFKRHDGQAVTCDDFLAAMADANGVELSSIGKWYSQAGTPHLHISSAYDQAAQTFSITARQSTPPSPGQPDKVRLPPLPPPPPPSTPTTQAAGCTLLVQGRCMPLWSQQRGADAPLAVGTCQGRCSSMAGP
jgi:hypothetical protein